MLSERNIKFLGVVIPGAVAAAGVVVSLWNLAETRRLESKRPFLERQLDLCFDASRTAARIASRNDDARTEAEARFWELYYGELALVEDRAVAAKMVEFGKALRSGNDSGLTLLSINVARACRSLILDSWDIDLPELDGR